MSLVTFNARTLSSGGSVAALLEVLAGINWDIIVPSEVRRTGEGLEELSSGHMLCYRRPQEKGDHGVGFSIPTEITGNVENSSASERVAVVVIKLNSDAGYR